MCNVQITPLKFRVLLLLLLTSRRTEQTHKGGEPSETSGKRAAQGEESAWVWTTSGVKPLDF